MEQFKDKTPVTHFAQLALDCYNSPKDDEYRKQFNRSWVKVDEWPRKTDPYYDPKQLGADKDTGFYGAFYKNTTTNVGAIAIRGTSSVLDYLVDGEYVFDIPVKQYEEALNFVAKVKALYPNVKKLYVCGHSLGGIIAKMIAPRIGLNTIAFNSPGVVQFLKKRNLPWVRAYNSDAMCSIPAKQTIITYCANGCPIGNLRHDNDVGVYKWLPVLGEKRIPDSSDRINFTKLAGSIMELNMDPIDAIDNIPDFVKHTFINEQGIVLLKYHSMVEMYVSLKSGLYQNDRI